MSIFYRFQDAGLDDWDAANNYMQMGFRPGFAIQARELTQMQTILQAQILRSPVQEQHNAIFGLSRKTRSKSREPCG